MTERAAPFVEFSDEDRETTGRLGRIADGDRTEIRVTRITVTVYSIHADAV
jgi:hypothetical protein